MAAMSASVDALPADVAAVARNVLILLQSRLSQDNQIRRDAEAKLVSVQKENHDLFALALLLIMRQEVEVDSRQAAALHLKILLKEDTLKVILSGKDDSSSENGEQLGGDVISLWGKLSPTTRQHIKGECLACLESEEPSKAVRNAICDTIATLGSRLLSKGEWPELQPKIFGLLAADEIMLQVSGLQLLGSLFGDLTRADKSVVKNMQIIQQVLVKLMPSPSVDVRYECVSLIASIVEIEKRSTWKHLQSSVPDILVCLQLAAELDTKELTRVLTLLIDIAEYDAGFYSNHLPSVTTAIFTLARNPLAGDEIKQLSVEVMLAMCEGKPKMCMKSPGLLDNLLNVLMEYLVTVEDNPEWESEDFDENEDFEDEVETFNVAEGGLDRVAASVGGDHVLPKLFGLAVQYLQQSQWKMKFAALVAIAQTVEHIPEDEVEKYLEKLVPICLEQLRDPHPRVRHAACRALGQAATDTSPIMQENHVNTVLPALMERLEDPVIRNRSHAARALSNYLESVRKEDATVYANSLIERLLSLCNLSQPKRLVAASVTCLAVVASIVENVFVPYQDRVVADMKLIVTTLSSEEDRFVREKALECISLVALAVGKDAFQMHAAECISAIVKLWSESIDAQTANADGSLTGAGPTETLSETLCRMCRVMGADFLDLPAIMPRVFKILGQRPRPANLETLQTEDLTDLCVVGAVNGKTMGLTSGVILDLEKMTKLLYTFATALGPAFEKWIAETVNHTLPLLEFQYCERIMQNVLNLLATAVQVGRQFADREPEPALKAGYMQLLARWTWQGVQRGISAVEDDHMLAETTLEVPSCAANLIRQAGTNMLIAEQVYNLTKQCVSLIEECVVRGSEAGDARKEEHDEDEEDDIQGEQRYELELAAGMVEIIGAVIEHHAELFVQVGSTLCLEFIQRQLAAAAADGSKPVPSTEVGVHIALYLVTELIQCGEQASHIWAPFQGTLLDGLSSADPSIRQSSSHGLKVIMKKTKVMSPDMVVTVANALLAALEKIDKLGFPLEDAEQHAYDNIVPAIGAVVFQQTEIVAACGNPMLSPPSLLQIWLNHLPIRADEDEAQLAHGELVDLILAENEEVIGPNMSKMPHLIKIFAQIYQLPMSNPEIDAKIVKIMQAVGDAVTTMGIQLESTGVKRNLERLVQDSKNAALAQQQQNASPQQ